MIRRPRHRTILLGVNLLILIVPVLGIMTLRIYETELIRHTEAEVIAQAAFIKAQAEREFGLLMSAGEAAALPEGFGQQKAINWPRNIDDRLRPIEPVLSTSSHPILEPEPAPLPPETATHPLMEELGARLEPVFLEAQKITMSGINLVDWQGNTLASTSESQHGHSLLNREEIQGAIDGEVMRVLRRRAAIPEGTSLQSLSRETSVRVFISLPISFEGQIIGAVTVWRTPQSLPKTIYENRTIFAVLLAFMLLIGLAMAWLTSFYLARPIQRLIAQTELVGRQPGHSPGPIDNPGTLEVQQLSEAIAEMAQTLEERAEYIRAFARNVSHEFKTPLTSIRGTVELLQDHFEEMAPEERDEFLALLEAETHRLTLLVRGLLELARADVTSQGEGARVELRAVLEELSAHYEAAEFEVSLAGFADVNSSESLAVAIKEQDLRSIFHNLINNAGQHGASQVMITLEEAEPEEFVLSVQDDGPGISPGNAPRIFDDFFTTTREQGGTGLGLSITKALLNAYKGSIRLVESTEGARFEVRLRRAVQRD